MINLKPVRDLLSQALREDNPEQQRKTVKEARKLLSGFVVEAETNETRKLVGEVWTILLWATDANARKELVVGSLGRAYAMCGGNQ